ncbi:hypothetical protein A2U01_0101556, partial [Trifolium medium]|nr:hypothetical protein [Trifolium medium]
MREGRDVPLFQAWRR